MSQDKLPSSRKEAQKIGSIYYFTGKPCKRGHVSKRTTSGGSCNQCRRDYEKSDKYLSYLKSEQRKNTKKKYYLSELGRKTQREYKRNLTKTSPLFRMTNQCRDMFHRTLRKTKQSKNMDTETALGYTGNDLLKHIESYMIEGMSWDNYGEVWEIDHKTPISNYVSQGVTDPSVINSLDNLLPMFLEHNQEKSSQTLEDYLEVNPHLEDIYRY